MSAENVPKSFTSWPMSSSRALIVSLYAKPAWSQPRAIFMARKSTSAPIECGGGGRSPKPHDLLPVLQRRGHDRFPRGGRARRRAGLRPRFRDPRRGRRLEGQQRGDPRGAPGAVSRAQRRVSPSESRLRRGPAIGFLERVEGSRVLHGRRRPVRRPRAEEIPAGPAGRRRRRERLQDLALGPVSPRRRREDLPRSHEGSVPVPRARCGLRLPAHPARIARRDFAEAFQRRHLPRARQEARARGVSLRGLPGAPLSPCSRPVAVLQFSAALRDGREHPEALVGDPRHARHAAQRGASVLGREGRGELGESPAVTAEAVPFLELSRAALEEREALETALLACVRRGRYVLGDEVAAFESEWAAFCEAPFAVSCASGTDAITLALRAFGVGTGDDVLTVSMTCAPTAAGILRAGATPVFVDVEPEHLTMDASRLEAALTRRTKAIVPVHLYGRLADIDAIADFAKSKGRSEEHT